MSDNLLSRISLKKYWNFILKLSDKKNLIFFRQILLLDIFYSFLLNISLFNWFTICNIKFFSTLELPKIMKGNMFRNLTVSALQEYHTFYWHFFVKACNKFIITGCKSVFCTSVTSYDCPICRPRSICFVYCKVYWWMFIDVYLAKNI